MKRILFLIPLIAFLIAEMFIVKASADLNDGLVAYYPFNGSANDESGNGNHGVVYGATLIEDRCGNPNSAYHFDGIDDYINAGNPELEKFSENFSFIVWINPQKGIYKWPTIIGKWNHSYHDTFFFGLDELSTGLCGEVTTTTGNYWEDSTIDLLNTWHIVAMTYDNPNTRMELYVDGNVIETFYDFGYGNLVNNVENDILIGGLFHHTYFYGFKGIIDEIRIYNRVLSVYEIRELFRGDITLIIPEIATEGEGILDNQGLISVFPAPNTDLAVNLSSDDISLVAVPETVTIYADQNSATFDIGILHNCIVNGSQTATITASACGYVSCSDTIQVADSDVSVEMNLPSGWSMISLPVIPCNYTVSSLFPGIKTIYGYEKGVGYVEEKEDEELEVGDGYWILLDQNQNFTLTGQPFQSYNKTIYEDEWEMIGGCTYPARASTYHCNIGVIYDYLQETGYQRVPGSQDLNPGKGYWMLFRDFTFIRIPSPLAFPSMAADFEELVYELNFPVLTSRLEPQLWEKITIIEKYRDEMVSGDQEKILTYSEMNPSQCIEYDNFAERSKSRISQSRLIEENNNELLFPEERRSLYYTSSEGIFSSAHLQILYGSDCPFEYTEYRTLAGERTIIDPYMTLKSNREITLDKGLYFFNSLTLDENSTVKTNGDVLIYVKKLELKENARLMGGTSNDFKKASPNNLIILAQSWPSAYQDPQDGVKIGPSAKVCGHIFAPSLKVRLSRGSGGVGSPPEGGPTVVYGSILTYQLITYVPTGYEINLGPIWIIYKVYIENLECAYELKVSN